MKNYLIFLRQSVLKSKINFLKEKANIMIKNYEKIKMKKIRMKNEVDVVTIIENEYKAKLFMNRLTIAIVQKQHVKRSFKNKNKNKNKIY